MARTAMTSDASTRTTTRATPAAAASVQPRVLLVEDVATVAATTQAALRSKGFDVEVAFDGATAVARKASFRPHIALIDLGLPDVDGIELVERFAADGDCGVIVVTANDEQGTRVAGLEIGADDYVVKPAPIPELIARINAVYRRVAKPAAGAEPRITVDTTLRCLLSTDGRRILLTEAEMAALETMLEASGNSVSRDAISHVALKRPLHADDRAVDQLIMKLRRKISDAGASERVILSARRQGYTIADPSLFRLFGQSTPGAPS